MRYGSLPEYIEWDDNYYPDDDTVVLIETNDFLKNSIQQTALWMVEVLPNIFKNCPYGECSVNIENDEYNIIIITHGWSGIESIIESLLKNILIKTMFYSAWKRGGFHQFTISQKMI